jgi:hypothetical protein
LLRRYALREGRRDELIDLFDREFVETLGELVTRTEHLRLSSLR